ncbi:carbohydrate ABC transporter permease [Gracilibacillus sp. HCP3S3_G5_1]|uniref:carbohydrate ABC transporter permease n=1 Tax=unclassified Gracilibacillus TaxID=2625209 RepID=UPI003F8B4CA7
MEAVRKHTNIKVGHKGKRLNITDMIILVILLFISFLSLLPVVHIFALSFSSSSAASAGSVTLFPVDFTFAPYTQIMDDPYFFNSFFVSVKRVLLGGIINFVLTVMMAFALSNETSEFRSRNIYMWIIIFAFMFNGGLIPTYMVVQSTGLIDTLWALVLPTAVPIFNVIILMNFFRGLPRALKDAAIVDGSGPWRMLIQIYVPLALPAIATVTLFSIVMHWNSFFDGLIYMNKTENMPLQTYIQQLVIRPDEITSANKEEIMQKASTRTFNAAKIVVTMLPILIIYPFLQKYFVKGITLGSVKE